jgi:hypothetical protein
VDAGSETYKPTHTLTQDPYLAAGHTTCFRLLEQCIACDFEEEQLKSKLYSEEEQIATIRKEPI